MEYRSFIGRKTELQRLDGFFKKAAGGQLQVAFIAGEAGTGKSTLAQEFLSEREAADSKLIVAVGQCNSQTGAGDPYLPFRQVLTTLTSDPEEEESKSKTDKARSSARLKEFVRVSSQTLFQLGPDLIGIFVPGASFLARIPTLLAVNSKLAEKLADRLGPKKGKEAPKADPALDQEKIFEQYAAVLKALSKDQTILLLLEDLQWADSGSVGLFFHLARQLTDSRLMLIGTFRPDDVALGRDGERHPLEPILNELKRYFGEIVVDLAQSVAEEGQAFTDALIDSEPNRLDADFRRGLFARTGGHPLFTVELLRSLQERGSLVRDADGYWIQPSTLDWGTLPARVEGVIGERLARLPEGLHGTLTTASVMGVDFAAQVIARARKLEERDLVRDLSRELEKRYRLVVELGESQLGRQVITSYRFSHALIQQFLYDELGGAERRLLHGDIAEALEAVVGSHAAEFAVPLARHYDEGRNAEKAFPYWILAGDAAFASYAQTEAAAAYTRALDLGKDVEANAEQLRHIYARRGRAFELNGQFEQALQNYAEMLAAARASGDRKMELDAMVATSTLYSTPTSVLDAEKGQALSGETLRLAAELGEKAIEAKVLWNLLLANLQDYNTAAAIDYGERSLALARELNLREQMAYTTGDLGWAYNVVGRFQEAKARQMEADALWRELGNKPMLNNNLNTRLLNLFWSGRYEEAFAVAAESLEVSRAIRNIWSEGWPHSVLGQIWFDRGEVDRALTEMETSLQLAKSANTPLYAAWYGANLCAAYVGIGAAQKAADLYRAVRVPDGDLPPSAGRTATLVSYALFEIGSGQLDLAATTLNACLITNSIWDLALSTAQCRLALAREEPGSVIPVAATVAENSRQSGPRQYLAEALLLKAKAHAMNGESGAAREALEGARLAAEELGSRRLLWQILAALAGIEPDAQKAEAWRAQARENVQFIADHMAQGGLQPLFLQLPDVRALLA